VGCIHLLVKYLGLGIQACKALATDKRLNCRYAYMFGQTLAVCTYLEKNKRDGPLQSLHAKKIKLSREHGPCIL
jgi:hypothetical protein